MSVARQRTFLGMVGLTPTNFGAVKVRVVDIKECYGRIRYFVVPLEGNGGGWIENVYQLKKEEG